MITNHKEVLQWGILSCFLMDKSNSPKKYQSVLSSKMFWIYEKYAEVILSWQITDDEKMYRLFDWDVNSYADIMMNYSTEFSFDLHNKIKLLAQMWLKDKLVSSKKELTTEETKKLLSVQEAIDEICNPETWDIDTILWKTETLLDNFKIKGIWYKTWVSALDSYIWWLRYGTLTRLTGYSNKWKSRFMYQTINNVIKQSGECLIFTLEVPAEYVLIYLTSNWFWIPSNEFEEWKHKDKVIEYTKLNKWKLRIIGNIYDLSGITWKIKSSKAEVVFIDFVQNIKGSWDWEYENMTEVARELQIVAAETWKAIFDLSQVSNEWAKTYRLGDMIPSKGSWALVHSADICIVIYWTDWTYIAVAKNKFGKKDVSIELDCDFSKSQFKPKIWF